MNLRSGGVKKLEIIQRSKAQKPINPDKQVKMPHTMATGVQQTPNTASGEVIKDLKGLEKLILDLKTDLVKQIDNFRTDFQQRSDAVKVDISNVRAEVRGMKAEIDSTNEKVTVAQQRISDLEDKIPTTNEALIHLLQRERLLTDKLDYMEKKVRANNIRIYQVKEGAEGADMVKFLKLLMSEKLDIHEEELTVVAAHRSARKKSENGTSPRSIVVRFLSWGNEAESSPCCME